MALPFWFIDWVLDLVVHGGALRTLFRSIRLWRRGLLSAALSEPSERVNLMVAKNLEYEETPEKSVSTLFEARLYFMRDHVV